MYNLNLDPITMILLNSNSSVDSPHTAVVPYPPSVNNREKAFKMVTRQAINNAMFCHLCQALYWNHKTSRNNSKQSFLLVCLVFSACFHAVSNIWLEPKKILFKWPQVRIEILAIAISAPSLILSRINGLYITRILTQLF